MDMPDPIGAVQPMAADPRFVPVPDSLRPYLRALMVVEVGTVAAQSVQVMPHDSLTLSVQLGRGTDCVVEAKGALGENTHLTGIREWTGSFQAAGHCVTLFALLTPLGAVRVLESQPMTSVPRIRARVADLLDLQLTRRLESAIAMAPTLADKLQAFASWLEERVGAQRFLAPAAMRAARAAMQVCADPMTPVDELAAQVHISRRQLERDFVHWIGATPRHLAQVSRLQWVTRRIHAGDSLAGVAADTGFTDQAHMTRTVRQLCGLTPGRLRHAGRWSLAAAFRAASGGRTVYL
jgi:AraC-like DNA-binding protein